MTMTRTITSAILDTTLRLQEKTVNSLDTTVPNGQFGNVQVGQAFAFDGTTGPSVTKTWHGIATLVAGVLTLDLTALTDATLGTVDMTGLKMRFLHIVAPSTNTTALTIAPGAANGYTGWVGSAGLSLNASDQEILIRNAGIAVDATHKTIDLAGTLVENVTIVMGFGA